MIVARQPTYVRNWVHSSVPEFVDLPDEIEHGSDERIIGSADIVPVSSTFRGWALQQAVRVLCMRSKSFLYSYTDTICRVRSGFDATLPRSADHLLGTLSSQVTRWHSRRRVKEPSLRYGVAYEALPPSLRSKTAHPHCFPDWPPRPSTLRPKPRMMCVMTFADLARCHSASSISPASKAASTLAVKTG